MPLTFQFEERLKILQMYFNTHAVPYARPLEHRICKGKADLVAEVACILVSN